MYNKISNQAPSFHETHIQPKELNKKNTNVPSIQTVLKKFTTLGEKFLNKLQGKKNEPFQKKISLWCKILQSHQNSKK